MYVVLELKVREKGKGLTTYYGAGGGVDGAAASVAGGVVEGGVIEAADGGVPQGTPTVRRTLRGN